MNNTPSHPRFVTPPNRLKQKVGYGGLAQKILEQAEKLVSYNKVDFQQVAGADMEALRDALGNARHAYEENGNKPLADRDKINAMLYPVMQIKAHGGMFHYPLATQISGKIATFLEEIRQIDKDGLDIVQAYYSTMRLILSAGITDSGEQTGQELGNELERACTRYFERNKG